MNRVKTSHYDFRKARTRRKIYGTPERPRLTVIRSTKHIYAQVIDDTVGHTLVQASTLDKEFRSRGKKAPNKETAKEIGKLIAERAKKKSITKVVFDRGGRVYHGRIQAVAEGAREGGLQL